MPGDPKSAGAAQPTSEASSSAAPTAATSEGKAPVQLSLLDQGAGQPKDPKAAGAAGGAATTDQKGKETSQADGAQAEAKKDATTEIAVKFPEGVEPDKKTLETFKALAKEAGLKGEHPQKLVDLHVSSMKAGLEAREQQIRDTLTKENEAWKESVKADKEIGGAQLVENLALARKAVDRFGGAELLQVLNGTGLSNNPVVLKALVRIGKSISEDTIAGATSGGDSTETKEQMLRRWYPKSPELFAPK
jgi:hypothetical protein